MIDPTLLTYAVYGLAAVSAILFAEAAYLGLVARRREAKAINRRLRLKETGDQQSVLVTLRKERGLDEAGGHSVALVALNHLFVQSGTRGNLLRYLTSHVMAGFAVFAALTLLADMAVAGVVVGLTLAIAAPFLILVRRRAVRRKAFAAQLPDALDIIVRSLRAGHPVASALAMVAREMPDPIGTEFGIVCDEVGFGLELDAALAQLSARVGLEDVRLFATTVAIQSSTGGNLAEILGNLADVIRSRLRTRRKIMAITAQARWSAALLSLIPFVVFGCLMATSPDYYSEIWDDPLVQPTLLAACVWMLVGDYIMYNMVNFRV